MTDRDLEQIIDAALPAYVTEPAPGLAERLTERVVARASRRGLPWWPVAIAAAAAACCTIAWRHVAPVKQAPPKVAVMQAKRPVPVVLPSKSVAFPQRTRPAARPIGASPQELRLAQFVAQHPDLAQQVLSAEDQGPVQPLSAPEPIEIQPLSNY